MINSHNSPESSIMKPLKTLKMLWFPALCQLHPTRAVYLDSTKGAHSFSWTELHRQLALTREESPLKVFFENSPFMYMYIYIYIYIYVYIYL